LRERQVKGIKHLVAIALQDEDLEARQVAVFDIEGNKFSNDFTDKAIFAQGRATFIDKRDGKTYKTTRINNQIWLAENLNYAEKGSKCGKYETIVVDEERRKKRDSIYAENDKKGILIDFANYTYTLKDENTEYCDKYGRLYDWETAMKACPEGWHLPTYKEWEKLIDAIGGPKAGIKLKSKDWDNGTDLYGFTALPGGYGKPEFDSFNPEGNSIWWSSTQHNKAEAYHLFFFYDSEIRWEAKNKSQYLYSVRCVEDIWDM